MGSCVMDTLDERKLITIDIPGAFLQRDRPQDKHPGYIMFAGIMVEIICEIDPSYCNNVIWSKDCKKNVHTDNSSKWYTEHYLEQLSSTTNYPNI